MADVTKCAICGRPFDAPVHFTKDGHVFKRIEGVPYRPKRGYSVWLFLGIAVLIAIMTAIILG
jgi:hypothetical protein